MLTVTYIFHSSFLVSSPECNVIFDFWKDPYGKLPELLDPAKPLYVVVSHFHKDHFNKDIFGWTEHFSDIHFILSKDTAKRSKFFFSPSSTHSGPHIPEECRSILTPGDKYHDNILNIRAFGSTDIGNSYLLEIDNKKIFHAGDLNAWIWKDESTPKEVEQAVAQFKKELIPLPSDIDIALFPVDSRIGTDYWEGAKIFLKTINVSLFIPMHYGLGSEEEQLQRRIDAAKFDLYSNPDFHTIFAGPLNTYGAVTVPINS